MVFSHHMIHMRRVEIASYNLGPPVIMIFMVFRGKNAVYFSRSIKISELIRSKSKENQSING